MTAAYLFLDVDGVLNPDRFDPRPLDRTFRKHTIGGYQAWVSQRQGTWLQSLRSQGTTIVWATTWVESTQMLTTLANRLGLPTDLPRIEGIDHDDIDHNSGKRTGVAHWLHEHGVNPQRVPCVWVDDMLGNRDRMWAWDVGVYPVTVEGRVGLADRRVTKTIEVGLGLDCHCDSEEA